MSNPDLSETEEAQLRQLLGQAADSIAVEQPDSHAFDVESVGSRRAGWLMPVAIAAAVTVIAAVGLFAWSRDGGERIDTGPATAGEVDFELQPGTGPWRLPPSSPDIEILDARGLTFFAQFGFAVDDPDSPTRWVAVMNGSYDFDSRTPDRVEALPEGGTLSIYRPLEDSVTGSTWMAASSSRASGSGGVNVAYLGMSDDEIIAAVSDTMSATQPGVTTEQKTAILSTLSQTADSAEPLRVFEQETDGLRVGFGFDARLRSDDGDRLDAVTASRVDTGLPPAVAGLGDRLIIEASRGAGRLETTVTERPDLGPGAFVVATEGFESPFLYDFAGTTIRVTNAAMSTTTPPTLDEQLRLVSRLVPMTRQELDAELARRQIRGSGSEPAEATTTTEPAVVTTVSAGS